MEYVATDGGAAASWRAGEGCGPVDASENELASIHGDLKSRVVAGGHRLLRYRQLCDSDLEECARLLWTVWCADSVGSCNEVISLSLLRSLLETENYLAGAFCGADLVGCLVSFLGLESHMSLFLYSHLCGVLPKWRDLGVGFELKQRQRAWALQRNIAVIRWTFDPLISRNAYLNICKLGAVVRSFRANLYGQIDDGVNRGDQTDRLVVDWVLPRGAKPLAPDSARAKPMAVPWALIRSLGAELIEIPWDIAGLRRRYPEAARTYRDRVRERFLELFARGYRVVGLRMEGGRRNWYVLLPGGVGVPDVPAECGCPVGGSQVVVVPSGAAPAGM